VQQQEMKALQQLSEAKDLQIRSLEEQLRLMRSSDTKPYSSNMKGVG